MAPTRIAVFCGAAAGNKLSHLTAARSLAEAMHANSIHLVYGGGTEGMMGEIAKTLVKLSGKDSVIGVIPSSMLDVERPLKDRDEKLPKNWRRRMGLGGPSKTQEAKEYDEEYGPIVIVKDLQARKKLMMELVRDAGEGSGFVALSGGFGTKDEIMEMVTWRQRKLHARGSVRYSVDGFWEGELRWLDKAVKEGFVREAHKDYLVEAADADSVIRCLRGKG